MWVGVGVGVSSDIAAGLNLGHCKDSQYDLGPADTLTALHTLRVLCDLHVIVLSGVLYLIYHRLILLELNN